MNDAPKCPVSGCESPCMGDGMLLCRDHWAELPEDERDRIYGLVLEWVRENRPARASSAIDLAVARCVMIQKVEAR